MVRPKIAKSGKFPFSCSQRRRHQRKRLERHSTTDLREEKPTQANNPFTPHDSDSNLSEMPSSGQVVAFYGPQVRANLRGLPATTDRIQRQEAEPTGLHMQLLSIQEK
jgi:hypothetical protein